MSSFAFILNEMSKIDTAVLFYFEHVQYYIDESKRTLQLKITNSADILIFVMNV